jgi:hypothetical protein
MNKNQMKANANLNTKIDIIKVAQLSTPRTLTTYVMHPQEPQLAVMWLTGELSKNQIRAALKATGLKQPNLGARLHKAIAVAYDKGLIVKG